MRAATIASLGSALPQRVVPNEEFARFVDTSDEWIYSRTGIRERRFAGEGETTSTLSIEAGRRALESAGVEAGNVDLVLVATISGDQPLPATAAFVQAELGARGAAFDLAAGCAGFVYGLSVAGSMVRAGAAETVLLVGAEVLSRFLNLSDRGTCVLFGDGAGAAVIVPTDEPGIVDTVLENDGRDAQALRIPAGGSRMPTTEDAIARGDTFIHMADGREIFRKAVVGMADACARLLDKAGVTPEDVSLVVPHQANGRIIKAVGERLGFPPDKVFVDLEKVGNTSAASIPIALDRAWRAGRIAAGDLVVTTAFGAGLAWGANLIRWTADEPNGGTR